MTGPPLPPQQYAHRDHNSSSIAISSTDPIKAVQLEEPFECSWHSSIVTRTMSPLLYSAISSAISPRDSQRKRAQSFVSPEFPRRVDRSDPIRRDPVRYRLVRYRHEARQPRVIAIAIAVPDCDSFYREPIDRVPNIDRSYDRTPRVFPSFIRFPGYPRVVGREKLEHGRIVSASSVFRASCDRPSSSDGF